LKAKTKLLVPVVKITL